MVSWIRHETESEIQNSVLKLWGIGNISSKPLLSYSLWTQNGNSRPGPMSGSNIFL